MEVEKLENVEKNPWSRDKNKQPTQTTNGTEPESNPGHIGGRRVLSPGCSHHRVIRVVKTLD